MAIQSSAELQKVSLSTILQDSDLFAQVQPFITEEFFTSQSYKLIYKSLSYYYTKTQKIPSGDELVLAMSTMYNPAYGSIEDAKMELSMLYNFNITDKQFIIEQLTTFIKRNNIESTLKDLLPRVQKGESVSIENIGSRLIDSLNVKLNIDKAFRLSDIHELPRVREESIGTVDSPTIIKSCIPEINNSLTFKGYKPGDVILFVAPPGSGKTMFMINECVSASNQGFNAFHAFVGDMKEYDGFIRYTSKISGIPQDELVAMSVEDQSNVINQCNYTGVFNRIYTKSYPAGAITMSQLVEDIYRLQKDFNVHFDLISIDYPDNLIAESTMMYESGGDIFNSIAKLGYNNKSVMIAGSQPKLSYWGDEIIPKEAAAESSKKQHVVDVMITAGKKFKGSTMITYFLAKVRRGTEGKIIRVKSEFDHAHLEQTTEAEYCQYIADNS